MTTKYLYIRILFRLRNTYMLHWFAWFFWVRRSFDGKYQAPSLLLCYIIFQLAPLMLQLECSGKFGSHPWLLKTSAVIVLIMLDKRARRRVEISNTKSVSRNDKKCGCILVLPRINSARNVLTVFSQVHFGRSGAAVFGQSTKCWRWGPGPGWRQTGRHDVRGLHDHLHSWWVYVGSFLIQWDILTWINFIPTMDK